MKKMRKTIVTILLLAMMGTILPAVSLPTSVDAVTAPNLLTGTLGTFEQATVPTGWAAPFGGTLSTSTTVAHSGSYSLKLAGRTESYYSPAINIYDLMKTNGAGTYYISIWVYVDTLTTSPTDGNILIRGTADDDNSFIDSYGGNYYGRLVPGTDVSTTINTWTLYGGYVTVLAADLTRDTGTFNLMIDNLAGAANQNLYFDDVQIYKPTETVEQWKMKEISFASSDRDYAGLELITGAQSTFEQASVPTGWSAFGGGTLSTSTAIAHSGSYSLQLTDRSYSWYSPSFNIYDVLKNNGAGIYTISLWAYVDTLDSSSSPGNMLIRGSDANDDNSFISNHSGNYYGVMAADINIFLQTWTQYSATFTVLDSDLERASGTFNVMIDSIYAVAGQNLYFDDFTVRKEMSSLMPATASTFESASVPAGWEAAYGGTLTTSTTVAHNGAYSAKLADRTQAWYSPDYNIYSILKNGGAGHYVIKFWIYVDAQTTSPSNARMLVRGADANDDNSFINYYSGNYYGVINSAISVSTNTWTECTASFNVLASDLTRDSGTFNLCIDDLPGLTGQNLYMDDVQIYKGYTSPLDDATMDVTFTGPGGATIIMPAFWDGGSTWKVRFAPTLLGTWNYTTSCSDIANTGLHNQTGTIGCVAYSGDLDIYTHGFVKTTANTRYFTYNDGTPFFYIGDTHWGMAVEAFDFSTVAGIDSQFKYIVDDRVSHGFTVYQSEPLGAAYSLNNGFNTDDLWGFYELDRRFQYIADQGLVHANAQLAFSTDLATYASVYSTDYLQKLSRYWVARYGAYPVMWTTAQEVDDDCYGLYDVATSPWKTVFNAVHQYDPYAHPQTAHQEYTVDTQASDSSYKDLTGYSWFASQWSPAKNAVLDFNVAKDYWNNSGSRPVVNYEGYYENLWTNEFGARQQGWTAYLNGMYGQGYGAQDIWYYNSDFDESTTTVAYGITITPAMKAVTWDTSVNFNTPTQLRYMKTFFQTMNWWQLTPRFDSTTWFANNSSYYSVASNDNDVYVAYFYNTTTRTGTLKNMDSTSYTAKWFNPRTGTYTNIGTITPFFGRYTIPSKPDSNDWVLYVYH